MTVEAEVNLTEAEEKVKTAILNLFPTTTPETSRLGSTNHLTGKATGLESLHQLRILLHQERILPAARKILTRGTEEGRILFHLNKQVAYVKHLSFCEPQGESPLGPITVTIETEDPNQLIDWLAPRLENTQSRRGTVNAIKSSARRTPGKTRFAPSKKFPSSS